MITARQFHHVIAALGDKGVADIEWAEGLRSPMDADSFASETIFVICNSGMRYTVARGIFDRCMAALRARAPVLGAFKHPGKVSAIETIWAKREELFLGFKCAHDKLEFLAALPWIGDITKYHLAKNFGLDYAKPDVHLQRLADREGTSAQAMCERLAKLCSLRVATVDTLLWRACADGIINSRTGAISGVPT